MQMGWYPISTLLAALVNLFLAWFVYLKRRQSAVNRFFSLTTALIAVWCFGSFGVNIARTQLEASFWNTLLHTGAVLIPPIALRFNCAVIGNVKKRKGILLFSLIVSIGFLFSNFSPLFIKGVKPASVVGFSLIPGPLYYFFLFFFGGTMLFGFCDLYNAYRTMQGRKRTQLKYFFLAFLLVFVGGITYFLLSLLPNLNFPPLDNLLVIGFTSTIAYAIVKHRLMDIRALVLKSVAYSIVLGTIAVAYAAGTRLIVQGYQGVISQSIFNILVIFAAIFGFNPLRRFVEKYTDRIFAKGRYNFRGLLSKLGKVVSSTVVLDELAENTLETLTKDMRLTRAAFVETGSTTVKEVKTIGYKRYAKSTWEKAVKLVASEGSIVAADELEEGSKERTLLRRLHTEVLVPLTTESDLVGVLALGEKRSGDMFTAEDLRLLEIMAPETAIAVQNAESFKQREIRIRELGALSKLALSLGSTLELDEILNLLIEQAIAVTGAENGSIMLLDDMGKTLSVKASRGLGREVSGRTRVKVGEGIAGYVAKTSQPTIIIDGRHENEYLEKCLRRDDITSSLTVPLTVKEKVIGVLSVNRKKKKDIFTEENLRLITSFAAQAAEAIENARLYDDLEDTFLGTITALAAAIDARDHYTSGHSEGVVSYATAIAKEFGFSNGEVKDIEIACRLHDIGKIGIDDAILNKPGRLTEEERKIIEQHPKIAVDILKSVDMLKDTIPFILYHHERIDGKGYPTGLAGEAIPLGARIIGVVDSFNAMVSDRPYRKALPLEVAISELERCSGTQFDSEVVKVFLGILQREKKYQPKKKAKKPEKKSA